MDAIEQRNKHLEYLKNSQQFYEQQTTKLLENLHNAVKNNFNTLQEELSNKLKDYTTVLENPEMYENITEKIDSKHKKVKGQQDLFLDHWKVKEEELLVGCRLKNDITDHAGNIIVPKLTVVTPHTIGLVIEKELYGELLSAIWE